MRYILNGVKSQNFNQLGQSRQQREIIGYALVIVGHSNYLQNICCPLSTVQCPSGKEMSEKYDIVDLINGKRTQSNRLVAVPYFSQPQHCYSLFAPPSADITL